MTARIQGMGWVTPLGRELGEVWEAIKSGRTAEAGALENPFNGRTFPAYRVDPSVVADVSRQPRLRRSSAISLYAVAAALDALKNAGRDPGAERLALVFASSNGGVIYTRRFFEEVSKSGSHAGSPLLFPETVYNAPASHIAALAGITGIATTLVNDATAAADAISTALELLDADACDRCVVVAAEEADWVLCEAYAAWGIEPIFSEGAAAILIGREGQGAIIDRPQESRTFRTIDEARRELAEKSDATFEVLVSAASGTHFDEAEAGLKSAWRFAPKASLGEAFAASALMQVVTAALALREAPLRAHALIPIVGFHSQVASLTLRAD